MTTLQEKTSEVVDAFIGKKGKALFELSAFVVDKIRNQKESRNARLKILLSRTVDPNWQYNEAIIKNFVKRRFIYYKSQKKATIQNIKSEIEHQRLARNVIITGQAGAGKTTALKWLFINANASKYTFVYLSAKMFSEFTSLEEISIKIEQAILGKEHCIIFFDGLDELHCVKGRRGELENFIKFFDEKSNWSTPNSNHKFIISTRPEHFEFHGMIKKNNTKKSLDNYIVFEIQMLNPKESLKICKSIKKLSKIDENKGYIHFLNKWPSKKSKKNSLSEKDYIKLLNQYLKETDIGESVLVSPLLCRYAYQIICDWNSQRYAVTDESRKTQSSQIEKVINSYIKWEFHDEHEDQTSNKKGQEKLNKYEDKVFDFLINLAGSMKLNDSIDKEQWRKIKGANRLGINAAFCVLQEYDDSSLSFIHKSFKDYFLSRYYLTAMENNSDEMVIENFTFLLKTNSAFSTMYIEQILIRGNALSKTICASLMEQEKDGNVERISEYSRGNLRFLFNSMLPFTIEEYLTVFPNGIVSYAGLTFNKKSLQEILSTGILEIENADCLIECRGEVISKSAHIIAIRLTQKFSNEFKVITLSFKCFVDEELKSIGGYWHSSFNKEDFLRILHKMELDDLLEQKIITLKDILNSELFDIVMTAKGLDDYQKQKSEYNILNGWINSIINFLGINKNYWCLFDGFSLYVYQMTKNQEEQITNLFVKGMSTDFFDYVALYGEYRAITENELELVQATYFRKAENIPITFNSDKTNFEKSENCLRLYYSSHWRNIQLFKKKNLLTNNQSEKIQNMVSIREIFDLYDEVEASLMECPNEKLRLLISDEKLITLYVLGEGDEMVKLAEDTLELCVKYNHPIGKNFREFLLDDNTGFGSSDRDKVFQFLKNYIWI